jgi:hypothetical protein
VSNKGVEERDSSQSLAYRCAGGEHTVEHVDTERNADNEVNSIPDSPNGKSV